VCEKGGAHELRVRTAVPVIERIVTSFLHDTEKLLKADAIYLSMKNPKVQGQGEGV
jgi:hypothetical protein